MSEERVISNLIDKAIIEALNEAEKGVLQKKILIRKVRERTNDNESLIAKRIVNILLSRFSILLTELPH